MLKVLAALAVLASAGTVEAHAQGGRVAVGVLECNVEGGIGLIIGSQREMACRFNSEDKRFSETYYGKVTRFGLDIGITGRGVMLWAVFAPTEVKRRGALAGVYGGVSGQASIGVGAGANILLGGSDRTVTLQPVSVQAQVGLNIAVGVSGLELFQPTR